VPSPPPTPDALLAPVPPAPPDAEAAAEQRPRGFRQRRTTLPRSTRGWSRGIVWSLIGLTSFSVIYGLIARIETSVNANGKLRPVGGVTSITAPFNAPVQQVLVKEGQVVKKGQPLIQLREQAVRNQRVHLGSQLKIWETQSNLLALRLGLPGLTPGTPAADRQLKVEQQDVQLRLQAATQELKRSEINLEQQASDLLSLRRRQAIENSITDRMKRLVKEGAMTRLELDRQEQRIAELEGTIFRTEKELESARYRIRESQLKQRQIPAAESKQLYAQYDNARLQLASVQASIDELDDRLKLGRMLAPIAGRIFNLSIKPGETLTPVRPALQILPLNNLDVELSVSNRDIGFLEVGMPVDIRVTSFPFTDYGSISGTIARIGADALPPDVQNGQEFFPVLVTINSSELARNGRTYQLRSGMAVTALIQLGSRPVISLISDRIGSFMESTRSIR
jgi:HlyD family secretion protein